MLEENSINFLNQEPWGSTDWPGGQPHDVRIRNYLFDRDKPRAIKTHLWD